MKKIMKKVLNLRRHKKSWRGQMSRNDINTALIYEIKKKKKHLTNQTKQNKKIVKHWLVKTS